MCRIGWFGVWCVLPGLDDLGAVQDLLRRRADDINLSNDSPDGPWWITDDDGTFREASVGRGWFFDDPKYDSVALTAESDGGIRASLSITAPDSRRPYWSLTVGVRDNYDEDDFVALAEDTLRHVMFAAPRGSGIAGRADSAPMYLDPPYMARNYIPFARYDVGTHLLGVSWLNAIPRDWLQLDTADRNEMRSVSELGSSHHLLQLADRPTSLTPEREAYWTQRLRDRLATPRPMFPRAQ